MAPVNRVGDEVVVGEGLLVQVSLLPGGEVAAEACAFVILVVAVSLVIAQIVSAFPDRKK